MSVANDYKFEEANIKGAERLVLVCKVCSKYGALTGAVTILVSSIELSFLLSSITAHEGTPLHIRALTKFGHFDATETV